MFHLPDLKRASDPKGYQQKKKEKNPTMRSPRKKTEFCRKAEWETGNDSEKRESETSTSTRKATLDSSC